MINRAKIRTAAEKAKAQKYNTMMMLPDTVIALLDELDAIEKSFKRYKKDAQAENTKLREALEAKSEAISVWKAACQASERACERLEDFVAMAELTYPKESKIVRDAIETINDDTKALERK